jgi:hypothetical protein
MAQRSLTSDLRYNLTAISTENTVPVDKLWQWKQDINRGGRPRNHKHYRTVDGTEERFCTSCEIWFQHTPENFFSTNPKRGGKKLNTICKPCHREKSLACWHARQAAKGAPTRKARVKDAGVPLLAQLWK